MSKSFIVWLAEVIDAYDPADFFYTEVMAETIAEEAREAGIRIIMPEDK